MAKLHVYFSTSDLDVLMSADRDGELDLQGNADNRANMVDEIRRIVHPEAFTVRVGH